MGAWEPGLAGVDCLVQGVAMGGRGGLAGMAGCPAEWRGLAAQFTYGLMLTRSSDECPNRSVTKMGNFKATELACSLTTSARSHFPSCLPGPSCSRRSGHTASLSSCFMSREIVPSAFSVALHHCHIDHFFPQKGDNLIVFSWL